MVLSLHNKWAWHATLRNNQAGRLGHAFRNPSTSSMYATQSSSVSAGSKQEITKPSTNWICLDNLQIVQKPYIRAGKQTVWQQSGTERAQGTLVMMSGHMTASSMRMQADNQTAALVSLGSLKRRMTPLAALQIDLSCLLAFAEASLRAIWGHSGGAVKLSSLEANFGVLHWRKESSAL